MAPKPKTNPISALMNSHLISVPESECLSSNVGGDDPTTPPSVHFPLKGGPHNPLLPSKEAFEND